jgi:FKBP-type peptidyl-prolyl cis-trans isomerase SlyD
MNHSSANFTPRSDAPATRAGAVQPMRVASQRQHRVIERDRVVGYRFTIRSDRGQVLEVSPPGQLAYYLHGAGSSPVGLEAQLEGRHEGDFCCITLPPASAFGAAGAPRQVTLPRSLFAAGALAEGTRIDAATSEGRPVPMWVLEAGENLIRIALDHPLAGRTLHFEITVMTVRKASHAELMRGRPSGRPVRARWSGPGGDHVARDEVAAIARLQDRLQTDVGGSG